jgi:transcriptional regulator with XRE-family HTH domain
MHAIQGGRDLLHSSLYKNRCPLTRPGSLPSIFRSLRIHRNLTKKELSLKFGYCEQYVTEIESGRIFPSLKYCLLCAGLFDANPNWVKNQWANEAIRRFSDRLMVRLGLE